MVPEPHGSLSPVNGAGKRSSGWHWPLARECGTHTVEANPGREILVSSSQYPSLSWSPGSSHAYGCVKVTTSPLHPVTKSSAPSAFPTEALFRQAGIYLAQGRDRGQRQQCPALSAEEVVSQGEKKRQQQKSRDQNCRERVSAA